MAVYPERRKGKLTGQWVAEVMHLGDRRRKRFSTKLEAERWADYTKLMKAPPPDEKVPVVAHSFAEVAKQALKHHPDWQGDRDHSRGQRLEYAIDFFGDKSVADITVDDLSNLVAKLKKHPGRKGRLSMGTVNRYLGVVAAVLTFARKRGWAPGIAVPWQREEGKRIHWLTIEQEKALHRYMVRHSRLDEALTLSVLCATGMRWSEFATLTPEQVTPEWVKLDKTKTDTPRNIPIDPDLSEKLREMVQRKGTPEYETFRYCLKRALKSAGQNPELSIHCLRHTTATRLVHAGVNLAVVQRFLGHKSINTTLKYTHVNDPALQDALKKLSPHAGQSAELVAAATKGKTPETPMEREELGAAGGNRTRSGRLCTPIE